MHRELGLNFADSIGNFKRYLETCFRLGLSGLTFEALEIHTMVEHLKNILHDHNKGGVITLISIGLGTKIQAYSQCDCGLCR